jgi:hypothetical protein
MPGRLVDRERPAGPRRARHFFGALLTCEVAPSPGDHQTSKGGE